MSNTSAMHLLFPASRRETLAVLLLQSTERYHLRELSRMTGIHAGTLARELGKLEQAGLVVRTAQGNQVLYQANVQAPLFSDLASMFRKTHGAASALREALAPLGKKVRLAWIYGSIARGSETPSSDVDLMVLGDVGFAPLVKALYPLHEVLRREVNPVLYKPQEFAKRAASGEAFSREVLIQPKIWIKGTDDDLAELVGHPPASGAHTRTLPNG
jgi:predicted nucleotidyltransferase